MNKKALLQCHYSLKKLKPTHALKITTDDISLSSLRTWRNMTYVELGKCHFCSRTVVLAPNWKALDKAVMCIQLAITFIVQCYIILSLHFETPLSQDDFK